MNHAPDPTDGAPQALSLPNPRHALRVPPHIDKPKFERIRQAAYLLPQVVKPSDYDGDSARDLEARLDAQGLVMLQKAVSGARPSRWIEPQLMDVALVHLDAVGNGPTVRQLMLDRTATLDALGISREGSVWMRVVSHTLQLTEPGWQVPVLFRVPVPAEAVWAYYRDGDKEGLQRALGTTPTYPHALAVKAHLDSLVARSRVQSPAQLDTLLPRLQSECALVQTTADPALLQQACDRVQERWEHRAREIETLAGLNTELAFQGYPDTFDLARRLQRSVTLYVGPPNSGKTHAAFEQLAQAHDGVYLAPLRLLALEGRDRLVARGVPCSLLTGEERMPAENARAVSSTIEMMATRIPVDVAVIDEAQMIFDP
ncbi:MAG: helicase, partial [Rhizobacter sp.]